LRVLELPTKNMDLHDRTVKAIFDLCKEYETPSGIKNYSKVYADHIGENYNPILISAYMPRKKPVAKIYQPDVWAQVRGKEQIDVFEVWHTETEDQAVRDILFSSLVRGIRDLCIVCTGQGISGNTARELRNLILFRIHDEEKNKLLDPTHALVTELPERIQDKRDKIKAFLGIKLEF